MRNSYFYENKKVSIMKENSKLFLPSSKLTTRSISSLSQLTILNSWTFKGSSIDAFIILICKFNQFFELSNQLPGASNQTLNWQKKCWKMLDEKYWRYIHRYIENAGHSKSYAVIRPRNADRSSFIDISR